jgi:exopolysaccharide biosynthesis WecB/TagA/CpsF family protein
MKKQEPFHVDRLIVHQFDPARPSPGGIDTCLRGLSQYAPADQDLAFVGVDTGHGPAHRVLGQWEVHEFGERSIWFLPAARLDPADQKRRVPHSLRLLAGLLRFRKQLPRTDAVQGHRMDIALALGLLVKAPLVYFIHTQENGLTGSTSDSMWRRAGAVHRSLEQLVVRRASDVVVFNRAYAKTVQRWNPIARFSPTWFDPRLIGEPGAGSADGRTVCWVGRLEVPKDPLLALDAMEELSEAFPGEEWRLSLLGSGTLLDEVRERAAELSRRPNLRVDTPGRVAPADVARTMAASDLFLMTSHAGYEGYPRVLVEAMASGLPAVVTDGSDTGGLVEDAVTGFTTTRDPQQIAVALAKAREIRREDVVETVAALSAPSVVRTIFAVRPAAERSLRRRDSRDVLLKNHHGRLTLGPWPLFQGGTEDLLVRIGQLIATRKPALVVTPNVDQVLDLQVSTDLRYAYHDAELRLVDGAPLVALAKGLGAKVQRHTGADLLPLLTGRSVAEKWRISILGGSDDAAQAAIDALRTRFPGCDVTAVSFPFVDSPSDPRCSSAVTALQEAGPDIVFLCLGSPKQENFFRHWRAALPPAVYIGAGAAVDFAAGTKARAPRIVQRAGLEWTWRLGQEPRRLAHRYLVKGPRFLRTAALSIARRNS